METIKHCPFCGEEILSTAKKCRYCGEWLPEQEEEKKEDMLSEKRILCPICAEPIEKDTKVCPHCHEILSKNEMQEVSQEPVNEEISSSNQSDNYHTDEQEDTAQSFFSYYFVDIFIRHYADFKGKISRKQFWMGYLCYAILITILMCIDFIIHSPFIITTLASIALIIPCIAFTVRRLHDANKSGWWFFISCVPLIGFIWLLVLLCQEGETPNETIKSKPSDWKIWLAIIGLAVLAVGKFLMTDDSSKATSTPIEIVEKANPESTDISNTENDDFEGEPMESGYFEGYIDGKYQCTFNLSFGIVTEDGIQAVKGTYYYNSKGANNTIIVEGNYSLINNELNLTEYFKDGTPNCTISAVNVPQGFRGTFTTPNGKEMDFFISPLYN